MLLLLFERGALQGSALCRRCENKNLNKCTELRVHGRVVTAAGVSGMELSNVPTVIANLALLGPNHGRCFAFFSSANFLLSINNKELRLGLDLRFVLEPRCNNIGVAASANCGLCLGKAEEETRQRPLCLYQDV